MRLRRLGQMSLAEIAYRGRQHVSRLVDRVSPVPAAGLAIRTGNAATAGAELELFRDAAPRRFFRGVEAGDGAELMREELPAACREILALASATGSRRFDLLGYEGLSFGETVDWHLDPVAGRRAPMAHWSRIDALDPAAVGDSKVIWELSRHQWLLPLAQAYWLTGDTRHAREAVDLVDSWSRANPYGMGINWTSSLEVAFRLIAWSWAFVLIRDASVLSATEFSALVAQIRRHAIHIERYLSRYYSPNTHLTGEALGLFYAGVLFAELPEAARWRKIGYQVLVDECRRQVRTDGVHFEQATCYQRYTIEMYLHFLILADRNDVAIPPDVRSRVERMVEFLLAVSAPDGTMPPIGDADGGWLLPLSRRAPADSRGVFAVAAAMFNRADFLWAARGPAPEVLWLLGGPGWARLRTLQAEPPSGPPSRLFPEGGYAVMRGDWTRDASQMIFDVGPLGCSVSGGHGHADLLSVQCWAFGEPYLVDPGTYCYTADRGLRDYFRGSFAHNTATVDGLPQAQPRGPFAWHARPTATLQRWATSDESDFADGWHDAYGGLPDPVRHRRRVLFVKPRYWVVIDDLIGLAEHDVELRFQFAPRPVTRRTGTWVAAKGRRGEGVWLGAFSATPIATQIKEGDMNPVGGWVSSAYGQRQPAPMVVYAMRARLPLRVATLILPAERLVASPPAVSAILDAAGMLVGLSLDDPDETVRFDEESVVFHADAVASGSAGLR